MFNVPKLNIRNQTKKIKKEITNWITDWLECDNIFYWHKLLMTMSMMAFFIDVTCDWLQAWWHFQSTYLWMTMGI
jgi:hypothetical protein